MVIPFTDRELEKAWRENKSVSDKTPSISVPMKKRALATIE
ncbi:hypothetical protein [Scytonema sp. NUACC26]